MKGRFKLTFYNLAMAGLLTLALVLRIVGAGGDLAQDEITSLGLATGIGHWHEVFWAVTIDNNHPLNSLWMHFMGADASPFAQRALSIVTGVASVLVAGVWGARRGAVTALITMLLFATSYIMVNYGSEARGYSGLILVFLAASLYLENLIVGKGSAASFGGLVLIGTLFHYDMAFATGTLFMWYLWAKYRQDRQPGGSLEEAVRLFTVPFALTGLALSPLLLRGYHLSNIPFHLKPFLGAYDLSLQTAANIAGPSVPFADLVPALVAACWWALRRPNDTHRAFYPLALLVMPITIIIFRLPGYAVPRHDLICDAAFLLLLGEMLGAAWVDGKAGRTFACIALGLILVGNSIFLGRFFHDRRGHYGEAVADMTENGPAHFTVDPLPQAGIVEYYGKRLGRTAILVPPDLLCETPAPEWLVFAAAAQAEPVNQTMFGPTACPAPYILSKVYPSWGLTGTTWDVYRRK